MTAWVFDLDGTLVDSAPDLCAAVNVVLAELGRPPITVEQARRFIGRGSRVLVGHALNATGELPEDIAPHHRRFLDVYGADHVPGHTRCFPEVLETLEALRRRGDALGLCTNKPIAMADLLLDALDLRHFFGDAVVGGGTLDVKKPHPEPILETLSRMKQGVAGAWMVGDSDADVLGGQNAGVRTVAVSFGYSNGPVEALGADRVIDGFSELLDLASG